MLTLLPLATRHSNHPPPPPPPRAFICSELILSHNLTIQSLHVQIQPNLQGVLKNEEEEFLGSLK